jgi:hypothetical protein
VVLLMGCRGSEKKCIGKQALAPKEWGYGFEYCIGAGGMYDVGNPDGGKFLASAGRLDVFGWDI